MAGCCYGFSTSFCFVYAHLYICILQPIHESNAITFEALQLLVAVHRARLPPFNSCKPKKNSISYHKQNAIAIEENHVWIRYTFFVHSGSFQPFHLQRGYSNRNVTKLFISRLHLLRSEKENRGNKEIILDACRSISFLIRKWPSGRSQFRYLHLLVMRGLIEHSIQSHRQPICKLS